MQGVLTNNLYEQGVTLEHAPLTTSFTLYRPLRKSVYNIILGAGATVTEKCIASSLAVETMKCEEFTIKDKTVKLERLLNNKKGSLRWATFVKCAQVTFNTMLARQLPQQYLGLCCILNYWWHSPLIHLAQWELNALLAQAVSQYAADVTSLKRILVSVCNTRAINLALQLARGAEVLLQIASVTHLPSEPLLLYNYFDGKLFSFYYYLSDKGATIEKLCDDLPDRIEMFKFLMMVVQSKNLSIDEEDDDDDDEEEEEEQKDNVNVSIVPEYEAISDDEDKVEVEPVTDDDELFDDAVTGPSQDKPANGKTDSVKEQSSSDVKDGVTLSGKTEQITSDLKEGSEIRSRLDRKDSTNGTVDEMMKLKMTSPVTNTRPRFPSFPSVTEESTEKEQKTPDTEIAKPSDDTQPASKQLFPINGKDTSNTPSQPGRKFRPNNGHEGCGPPEPAPPGLEPVLPSPIQNMDIEQETAESEFKPRIPLPPLPDPMPLYSDPLFDKGRGGFNSYHSYPPAPTRYKRHSDKENYGSNPPGRQPIYSVVGPHGVISTENPVKRHKSEES